MCIVPLSGVLVMGMVKYPYAPVIEVLAESGAARVASAQMNTALRMIRFVDFI
jgi:hypothetical protein